MATDRALALSCRCEQSRGEDRWHNDRFIDPEYMAYMLQYDSVYGRFKGTAKSKGNRLVVDRHAIVSMPRNDPRGFRGQRVAEYIVESTGVFTTFESAGAHLKAGGSKGHY